MQFLVLLQAEQGGISADLMDIEGLGPKRVRQLQIELGITSVAQLVDAAKRHKLQVLPLWDEIMEKKSARECREGKRAHQKIPT